MKTLLLIVCYTSLLQAQGGSPPTSPAQSGRPIGVIQTIDTGTRRITIKTDAGPEMIISFDDATRFLRVAPGAKDLTNAISISAPELGAGDRILARGRSAGDPNSLAATSIIVMSKADIARKHTAERAEWEKRGIGGVITVIDSFSAEITIKRPAVAGSKPLTIALAPNAVLRRYAPNSVKFGDARPCRFEDLQVGDQVRALGSFNEDRTRFTAEELVSGSFRNIVGTVVSLDTAQNTIVIADLTTGKRVQAQVIPDTTVRRLSDDVAQMIAVQIQTAASPSGPPGSFQPDRRHSAEPAGTEGDPPRQQSNGYLQAALEGLPQISLADVKVGEAVILSCTGLTDLSSVTAITLLAGVEPVLRASSKGGRPLDLGSWSLDLNMSAGVP